MHHPILEASISPLRQRLIDDMNMRRFSRETQRNYLRYIGRLRHSSGVHQTQRPPMTCVGSRSSRRKTAFPCRR